MTEYEVVGDQTGVKTQVHSENRAVLMRKQTAVSEFPEVTEPCVCLQAAAPLCSKESGEKREDPINIYGTQKYCVLLVVAVTNPDPA